MLNKGYWVSEYWCHPAFSDLQQVQDEEALEKKTQSINLASGMLNIADRTIKSIIYLITTITSLLRSVEK